MVLIEFIDDILYYYLHLEFMVMWFFPLIAMAFLSCVPGIIRNLISWR